MKLDEMKKQVLKKEVPYGTGEYGFEGIEFRSKEEGSDEIDYAIVNIKDYKNVLFHIFPDWDANWELHALMEQLGIDTIDKFDEVKKGTKIRLTKKNDEYSNITFRETKDESIF